MSIALATDYDAGLEGNVPEVTAAEVMETFKHNAENLKKIMQPIIRKIPVERNACQCAQKVEQAVIS